MCDDNFFRICKSIFVVWGGGEVNISPNDESLPCKKLLLKVLIIITRAFDVLIASHNHLCTFLSKYISTFF